MNRLFDYIFYRWFCAYSKHDSDARMYASVIVSAYQLFTLINLVLLISIILGYEYPGEGYLYVFIVVFYTINYFRYEREFDFKKLDERWKNEPISKRSLNWSLLVGYLIVAFFTPIFYGFATT